MGKILITGGSGLLGSKITEILLKQGLDVNHLSTRKKYTTPKGVNGYYWNPESSEIDLEAFDRVSSVIHLAGASVAGGRWTRSRKRVILNSRIDGTRLIVDSIKGSSVKSLIGASAIGYYGSKGTTLLTEKASNGEGFLADVCEAWEKEYHLSAKELLRKVVFRIGIVLANQGGALPEMEQTLPFFIGVLGNGKQIYSWIHIEDLARMFIAAITNENIKGVYNAVAPNPVSQKEIAQELARVNNVFTVPTPSISLKLILGEMSQMVLMSQNCSTAKIEGTGFEFEFPKIRDAIGGLHKN